MATGDRSGGGWTVVLPRQPARIGTVRFQGTPRQPESCSGEVSSSSAATTVMTRPGLLRRLRQASADPLGATPIAAGARAIR